MSVSRHFRVVSSSDKYDLLVTWPFATPWTIARLYAQVHSLVLAWDLRGEMPPMQAMTMLFANLLGWWCVRWRGCCNPACIWADRMQRRVASSRLGKSTLSPTALM